MRRSALSVYAVIALRLGLLASASASLPPFMRSSMERGRGLALCERHDESDSSVARCDEWCKFPEHCEYGMRVRTRGHLA